MGELQVFTSGEFGEVRVLDKDGEPWFVAKDICEVLGIANASQAVEVLDNDEKLIYTLHISGQNRDVLTVNESGLYTLVMRSNKPNAKAFRKWVTSEVLPSIRKHGGYMAGQEQMTPEQMLLASMNWLQSKVAEQQEQITAMQPKAVFYDIAMEAENTFSMDEVAKLLKLPYGRNTLFKTLREMKILNQNNIPYQNFINDGYFKIVEKPVFIGKITEIKIITRATQKGLAYISRKIS